MAMVLWAVVGEGPRVVLTSQQRIAPAPAAFRPVARVYDPRQELQCPVYEWDWGDGCVSRSEPECDPFEDPSGRRTRSAFEPKRAHVYHAPGEYRISFTVTAGDRKLRDQVRVVVTGPTLGQ